jgi:hypothetical protein
VFYDTFGISIEEVNCFITHTRASMRRASVAEDEDDSDSSQWRLVPQFDLHLTLRLRNSPIAAIPQVKLSGRIPLFELNLNRAYVKDLWRVIRSLIPPPSAPLAISAAETSIIPSTPTSSSGSASAPPSQRKSSISTAAPQPLTASYTQAEPSAANDDEEEVFQDALDVASSKHHLARIFALDFGVERARVSLQQSSRDKTGVVTVSPLAEVPFFR